MSLISGIYHGLNLYKYFFPQLDPVRVAENADIGSRISTILAKDPDKDSQLRFKIDYTRSEGRDENGRLVQHQDWQVRVKSIK